MSEEAQTIWKRIKVPAELVAAGWKLIKRDTSAPFALVNKKLDLDTGGFPDPTEAINAASVLVAEAAAIITDGAEVETGPRPVVLPATLIDEGWRLHKHRSSKTNGTIGHFAMRGRGGGLQQTGEFTDPADAVAEAIKFEAQRQKNIEAQERATGAGEGETGPEISGALIGDDEVGNGHQDTPAEVVLALDLIRTDGGTQQRSLFDPVVVEDYAEALEFEGADHFPAVDVFFDGTDYWLADGFYRVAARRQLNLDSVPAHVRQGTQRDAILWSLGANARHGLRRTPEDKRRAVLVMLRDPEWCTWSDGYIADRVKVSAPFVRKLRRQVQAETTNAGDAVAAETSEDTGATSTPPATTKRRGRDGRVQDTARIGKPAGEDSQLDLDETDDTGEVAETAPTNKTENGKPPAPAVVHRCADCDKEIEAGQYQNDLGQCWECAGMDKKKPKPRPCTIEHEIAGALAATVLDLLRAAKLNLKISFYFLPTGPKRVLVSITAGELTTEHDLDIVEMYLPPAILPIIDAHVADAKRAARKAKRLANAKPPAPAKPTTRKPAAVAHLKRTAPKAARAIPNGSKKKSLKKSNTVLAPAAKKSRGIKPAKGRRPRKQ